jgi:hypothetical protein
MTWPFEKLDVATEIQGDERLRRSVEDATRLLQRKVGKSARRLQVRWSMVGPGEVRLTLADSTGEVSGNFRTDDLVYGFRLKRRLSRLWGDLLDTRMDIQLDRILHPEDEVAVS